MDVVVATGAEYGLKINWDKVDMMAVRCHPQVTCSRGVDMEQKSSLTYLGALLDESGRIHSELSRRLGMATADYKALAAVWGHANVSHQAKYRIYMACIAAKLLYGLQSAWLTQVQRKKLDAFHARCLRKILRVPHSYYSRVSNKTVLGMVHSFPLSRFLLEQQLLLFGKIYRRPLEDVSRRLVFNGPSDELRISTFKRARGRPRLNWAAEVRAHAVEAAGTTSRLRESLGDHDAWRKIVRAYSRNSGPT